MFQNCAGQWLKGAGNNHILLFVLNIINKNKISKVFVLSRLLQGHLFNVIKHLKNLLVCTLGAILLQESQSTEKGRDQKLSSALLTIQINVKKIIGIKLSLKPGAAIRNNPERMQSFPVGMRTRLKSQTR